jgi:hypothetical protein
MIIRHKIPHFARKLKLNSNQINQKSDKPKPKSLYKYPEALHHELSFQTDTYTSG